MRITPLALNVRCNVKVGADLCPALAVGHVTSGTHTTPMCRAHAAMAVGEPAAINAGRATQRWIAEARRQADETATKEVVPA